MNSRAFCCATLLQVLSLASASGAPAVNREIALAKSADWLLRQQAADGGWHSATYGQMKSGVGNSALVLDALARMPPTWRAEHQSQLDRGIDFLLAHLDKQGYVSASHHSADYPTYATALLLDALDRMEINRWHATRRRMREYLLAVQRTNSPNDTLNGGWPHVGGDPREARVEANVNLSVTRFAVEAIQYELKGNKNARLAALAFLERCQNTNDGGFFFIPDTGDPLNKAGVTDSNIPRSYGTATADGLAALVACGIPATDPRVQAALHWLETHDSLDTVPGFEDAETAVPSARDALRFYYYAALARVIELFPYATIARRRDALAEQLLTLQLPGGSWSNPNSLMREDDPLIATALAISALATLQTPPE